MHLHSRIEIVQYAQTHAMPPQIVFQLNIDRALWAFYIDNIPNGQHLIRHPVDRIEFMVGPKAHYPPMRKIYCDRRVISTLTGQLFYRVQGTKGWIVDRCSAPSRGSSEQTISMLLPESNVQTGLFAFRCKRRIVVRMQTDEFVAPTVINKGQIIVADVIRKSIDYDSITCLSNQQGSEESPANDMDLSDGSNATVHGDDPYLRLSDGSGWLFRSKAGEDFLERNPLEIGSWKLKCVSPTPVSLCRQPIDRQDMMYPSKSVKHKSIINCDVRIPGTHGIVYYRVTGTDGYIFDRNEYGDVLFELMATPGSNESKSMKVMSSDERSWTSDFVRGIASLIDGIKEVEHDTQGQFLSFSAISKPDTKVIVYYATKIVGSSSINGLGNTQVFRKQCSPAEVADMLRTLLVTRATKTDDEPAAMSIYKFNHGATDDVTEEEEQMLRQELIDCYAKSETLKHQQLVLLRTLKKCDDKRALAEQRIAKLESKRKEELQTAGLLPRKKSLVCEECGVVFKDARAKQKHWTSVHSHRCNDCGSTFPSVQELVEHQDEIHSRISSKRLSKSLIPRGTAVDV